MSIFTICSVFNAVSKHPSHFGGVSTAIKTTRIVDQAARAAATIRSRIHVDMLSLHEEAPCAVMSVRQAIGGCSDEVVRSQQIGQR
jgi:hypothetical protein